MKVFFPWGSGMGTFGVKVGRFYADIYWLDWETDWLPAGIFICAPWVKVRDTVIGGGKYRLTFCRFWRGFRRQY